MIAWLTRVWRWLTCENCRAGIMGSCPECYYTTLMGCPHGELCAECRYDLTHDMPC